MLHIICCGLSFCLLKQDKRLLHSCSCSRQSNAHTLLPVWPNVHHHVLGRAIGKGIDGRSGAILHDNHRQLHGKVPTASRSRLFLLSGRLPKATFHRGSEFQSFGANPPWAGLWLSLSGHVAFPFQHAATLRIVEVEISGAREGRERAQRHQQPVPRLLRTSTRRGPDTLRTRGVPTVPEVSAVSSVPNVPCECHRATKALFLWDWLHGKTALAELIWKARCILLWAFCRQLLLGLLSILIRSWNDGSL